MLPHSNRVQRWCKVAQTCKRHKSDWLNLIGWFWLLTGFYVLATLACASVDGKNVLRELSLQLLLASTRLMKRSSSSRSSWNKSRRGKKLPGPIRNPRNVWHENHAKPPPQNEHFNSNICSNVSKCCCWSHPLLSNWCRAGFADFFFRSLVLIQHEMDQLQNDTTRRSSGSMGPRKSHQIVDLHGSTWIYRHTMIVHDIPQWHGSGMGRRVATWLLQAPKFQWARGEDSKVGEEFTVYGSLTTRRTLKSR